MGKEEELERNIPNEQVHDYSSSEINADFYILDMD